MFIVDLEQNLVLPMAETLTLPVGAGKEEIYKALVPQIKEVISVSDDSIANMANIAAILKQAFNFHWVGFYRTTAPQTLVLGPFQGPLACVTIPFSKGVCGAAASQRKTVLVPDVEQFPGHIACSSLSRSEIVIPLVAGNETRLILDIDSDKLNDFNAIDQSYLEEVVRLLHLRHFSG